MLHSHNWNEDRGNRIGEKKKIWENDTFATITKIAHKIKENLKENIEMKRSYFPFAITLRRSIYFFQFKLHGMW